jgi:hypothetical protein
MSTFHQFQIALLSHSVQLYEKKKKKKKKKRKKTRKKEKKTPEKWNRRTRSGSPTDNLAASWTFSRR